MRVFQQSESVAARRDLFVQMVSDDDGLTPATGKQLTVELVKAGGSSYAAIAGSSAEIGDGTYKISLATGDLDTVGEVMLQITATGCLPQYVSIQVFKFLNEIHLLKAILLNSGTHNVADAVDQHMDDDGLTPIAERTAVEEISVVNANWINATKYLTLTDGFVNYVHKTGDVIDLTAGTGVVTGEYTITAKIDADTIELASDINGGSDDIDDDSVAGTINNGNVMFKTTEL